MRSHVALDIQELPESFEEVLRCEAIRKYIGLKWVPPKNKQHDAEMNDEEKKTMHMSDHNDNIQFCRGHMFCTEWTRTLCSQVHTHLYTHTSFHTHTSVT